jgi:uncharacterized protein YmfQ (DUF2313 family)
MSGQLAQYTDDDFLAGFLNLLPDGPVWPKVPAEGGDAPVLVQTSRALIKGYTRNAASAAALLSDAFPVAPVDLLPEWEATLGLPDPCAGPSPTIQARQQQVNARFVGSGGQTPAYFINVAAALGYPITITQFAPFRVGQAVGSPLYSEPWAYAWQINAPTFVVEYFRVGRDAVGEPLAQWGNTVLQCEMQRLAPAHTTLLFSYSLG